MTSKKYLQILFLILGSIFSIFIFYAVYFSKHYPIPMINHISFDAKMQFIRENIDTDKIDTLIVGSSLALNNVQGMYLEKSSKLAKNVLNISVWSISALQVEQILELSDAFPQLKRIIYTGQFTSFNHADRFKDYDANFIKKYIRNELNPIKNLLFILDACKDISFCIKRQQEWLKNHGQENTFGYLGFDYTGSVALNIFGDDIVQKRWTKVDGSIQNPNALGALKRMAKKAKENGIQYYFIQQPYRQAQIDKYPHIQDIMQTFPQDIKSILLPYNGKFLNLHEVLKLTDAYFADRSHLNSKGSKIVAEVIGKFIDKSEMK